MLSLYIHIPFCVRKCHYCSFYSTVYSRTASDNFVTALAMEAEGYQSLFKDRVFESIYIGGGTPTALGSDQLKQVVKTVRQCFKIATDAEWTIEANPNTCSASKLAVIGELGLNRLSLGVQSFSNEILKKLGRVHTAEEAFAAYGLARRIGFSNISIDLIYGIPGQTEQEWIVSVEKALELRPEHISAYSLSIEDGSWFREEAGRGRFALPDDAVVATQYEQAVEKLACSGYNHYEISNFSLPGFSCRHNLNYWARGEYLGLGPGAWSFISGKRYHSIEDAGEYSVLLEAGQVVIEEEDIPETAQAASETIMLGIRTSRGVDLVGYESEFGKDRVRELLTKAAPLEQNGLLEEKKGTLTLTKRGFLLANQVITRLIL